MSAGKRCVKVVRVTLGELLASVRCDGVDPGLSPTQYERPATGELGAEGWRVLGSIKENAGPPWLTWSHHPSYRVVMVQEWGDGLWHVSVSHVTPEGNPLEVATHGPFARFGQAVKVARMQRRHILADSRKDVAIADQSEISPAEAG